jgi:phosphate:Na+ symporter
MNAALIVKMLTTTFGGLALFLYGMNLMSDGLKKAAGQRMKQMLKTMTSNPLAGFSMGTVSTAMVQSSSATTVMIIGLVNAGLMTLKQAICVIFGTNVGTTATAWIVSLTGFELKISAYALPIITVGFLMDLLGKRRSIKSTGQILIGFGILFIGIGFMKDAFAGIKGNEAVEIWLTNLAGRPILAMIGGTVITMLLQSSSASILIVQTIAVSGAFGSDWGNAINIAIPFVLGCNIGTTITAQIASLGTNLASRQTAWAHTLFNLFGTLLAIPFVWVGWFGMAVDWLSPWELNAATVMPTIAVAHTLFNVVTSVIFLPMAGALEKIVMFIIRPKAGEVIAEPVVLETHLLDTPSLALQQAKYEITRMAKHAKDAVNKAMLGLTGKDRKSLERARQIEDSIDEFQHEITSYLVLLSQKQLDNEVSVELPVLLHMVNDLERVGDHAVNIVEIAERKIDKKFKFSEAALKESEKLFTEVNLMLDNIIAALKENDIQAAHRAMSNEGRLNKMQVEYRRSHVQRMTDGRCDAQIGLIFIDLVDNIEKIGDHLTNVAQSVIGGLHWDGIDDENTLSGQFDAVLD